MAARTPRRQSVAGTLPSHPPPMTPLARTPGRFPNRTPAGTGAPRTPLSEKSVLGKGKLPRSATKSPATKRGKASTSSSTTSRDEDSIQDLVHISDLANKTWNLHRVSTALRITSSEFKEHAKRLNREFQNELEINVHSVFREVSLPTGQRFANGVRPICIAVHEGRADGKIICVVALIPSTKNSENVEFQEMFSVMPMVMTRGMKENVNVVLKWLTHKFDCTSAKGLLPPWALSSLLSKWGLLETPESKNLEISLSLPPAVVNLRATNIVVSSQSFRKILSVASDGDEAMDIIMKQFESSVGIKVEACTVTKLATSAALVSRDGKLKVLSEIHVMDVLRSVLDIFESLVNS